MLEDFGSGRATQANKGEGELISSKQFRGNFSETFMTKRDVTSGLLRMTKYVNFGENSHFEEEKEGRKETIKF